MRTTHSGSGGRTTRTAAHGHGKASKDDRDAAMHFLARLLVSYINARGIGGESGQQDAYDKFWADMKTVYDDFVTHMDKTDSDDTHALMCELAAIKHGEASIKPGDRVLCAFMLEALKFKHESHIFSGGLGEGTQAPATVNTEHLYMRCMIVNVFIQNILGEECWETKGAEYAYEAVKGMLTTSTNMNGNNICDGVDFKATDVAGGNLGKQMREWSKQQKLAPATGHGVGILNSKCKGWKHEGTDKNGKEKEDVEVQEIQEEVKAGIRNVQKTIQENEQEIKNNVVQKIQKILSTEKSNAAGPYADVAATPTQAPTGQKPKAQPPTVPAAPKERPAPGGTGGKVPPEVSVEKKTSEDPTPVQKQPENDQKEGKTPGPSCGPTTRTDKKADKDGNSVTVEIHFSGSSSSSECSGKDSTVSTSTPENPVPPEPSAPAGPGADPALTEPAPTTAIEDSSPTKTSGAVGESTGNTVPDAPDPLLFTEPGAPGENGEPSSTARTQSTPSSPPPDDFSWFGKTPWEQSTPRSATSGTGTGTGTTSSGGNKDEATHTGASCSSNSTDTKCDLKLTIPFDAKGRDIGGHYGTGPTPGPNGELPKNVHDDGPVFPDLTDTVLTATTPILFFVTSVTVALLGYSLWKRTIIDLHLEVLNECEAAAWDRVKDDYWKIVVEEFMGGNHGRCGAPVSSSNQESTAGHSTTAASTTADEPIDSGPYQCPVDEDDPWRCMENIQLHDEQHRPYDPEHATSDCIHWINWIDRNKHTLRACTTQPRFLQLKAEWKQYLRDHMVANEDNGVSSQRALGARGNIPSADMTKLRLWKQWVAKQHAQMSVHSDEQCFQYLLRNIEEENTLHGQRVPGATKETVQAAIISGLNTEDTHLMPQVPHDEHIPSTNVKQREQQDLYPDLYRTKSLTAKIWILLLALVIEHCELECRLQDRELYVDDLLEQL
ncbi:hypothetical protein AK88_05248 [Plasmodium fragile]|uniref:Schizont-infected cell agglutination extracellular alpha domain-containing protein n=1 Tax=Plasmodium fragile TaxID=5857 RepID=A0A0D9QDP4_PLAFR|nr:uncharacterized protein AK88_05248 [Plasmodium fragile]KJP85123.1 hypothetical protein AK88_05248 [Plasmodium fragile]